MRNRQAWTDLGARADAQQLHDPVAVEVGPDPAQVLRRGQLPDPPLQRVVGRRQRRGPLLVPRRGVRPHQLVQPGEQVTGVGDVAADGRVGPLPAAVAVEAQVQEGQPGHRLDDVLGVPQRGQPLAHQLGADHLVVVEGDPAARLVPAGGRLADVVQQRGQPQHQVRGLGVRIGLLQRDRLVQHGQRVAVDVLVLVVLVDLHPQRRQLGQHDVGQPGGDEQLQRRPGRVLQQRLGELALHPLGGDPAELGGQRGHRRDHLVVRGQPQLGDEADGPQHPQRVVGEGVDRRPGGPQPAGQQVTEAAEGIGDGAVGAEGDRHGVDGEVAAGQVVDQRGPPGDLRVARLPVVAVGAEGGDLQPHAAHLRTDRAEGDARVPRGTGPAAQQLAGPAPAGRRW